MDGLIGCGVNGVTGLLTLSVPAAGAGEGFFKFSCFGSSSSSDFLKEKLRSDKSSFSRPVLPSSSFSSSSS